MVKKGEDGTQFWKQLYQIQKGAAKRRGIPFLLTLEEYTKLASQECYYCGDLPTNGDPDDTIIYQGIDRVDNEKGYTRGNCIPCCAICNRSKGVMYFSGFLDHITKIYMRHKDTIKRIKEGFVI